MDLDFKSDIPIYIQIARQLEDAIFTEIYAGETQIPSTTEISVSYKINPATVLKGMNILVDDEIIYKRRGVGMFVTAGARNKIMNKRKKEFTENFVNSLIDEARKLELSREDVIKMIERSFGE